MGSPRFLDVGTLGAAAAGAATEVWRIRLEGAAWFNLYVVARVPGTSRGRCR